MLTFTSVDAVEELGTNRRERPPLVQARKKPEKGNVGRCVAWEVAMQINGRAVRAEGGWDQDTRVDVGWDVAVQK